MRFNEFLLTLCPVSEHVAHDQLGFSTENLLAAYTAGLLRAAEICKSKHENMDSRLNYVAGWLDAEAAIRKEAGE